MAIAWHGGTPEVTVFEGVEGRVLVVAAGRGRVALTLEEARGLHGWLGRLLWARDDEERKGRVG